MTLEPVIRTPACWALVRFMIRHVCIVFLLGISFQANGTIQIDDILVTGANTEITISELPLEGFENWKNYAEYSEFDGCSASWRG